MTTPPPPLDAAEDDPDATEAASLPGYSAGDRTTAQEADGPRPAGTQAAPTSHAGDDPAVGPPAQDASER